MITLLILTGFIGIGLIGFAVGFRAGAHFGYKEGFEGGRNTEGARWIFRLATPECLVRKSDFKEAGRLLSMWRDRV